MRTFLDYFYEFEVIGQWRRSFHVQVLRQARFPFKHNRLRWQAANHGCHCFDRAFLLWRNKRKRQPIGMLGRNSVNHDWLHANSIACVSCGFRLRNARNASDCVWMETGLHTDVGKPAIRNKLPQRRETAQCSIIIWNLVIHTFAYTVGSIHTVTFVLFIILLFLLWPWMTLVKHSYLLRLLHWNYFLFCLLRIF